MITQEYLQSLYHYDKNTGIFTRLISRNKRHKVGEIAGTKNFEGYSVIIIDGISYRAHRLAWLYIYGSMPKNQIDHINGIKDDNRICNLREVSNAENQQNRVNLNKNNKSGVTGIDMRKGKYRVRICIDYKSIHIGEYKNIEDAKVALYEAKRKLHPFSNLKELNNG